MLNDPSRFKVAVCGRRWGKTALGLIATALGHGQGKRPGAIHGKKVWWVAPDYPTADDIIWPDLQRLCEPVTKKRTAEHRRLDLIGGGNITVKSASDPTSLVGVGLDGLVIDEAAKIHPDAWYRSLRPTLSDKQGWAIFIGTPNGFNWVHDIFEHASHEPDWARWQLPSSENPLMPANEIEAARRDSPAFFGQEYLAQFTSIEGAEFPADWFNHIGFDEWPTDGLLYRVNALDPSKGKSGRQGDYSAIISLAIDRHNVLWVDADMAIRDTTRIIADSLRIFTAFGGMAFGIETNSFQELLAGDMKRAALEMGMLSLLVDPIVNTINKEVRIRQLGTLFADKRIRIRNTPGGRLLLAQLRDFRPPPHPAGYHDDGPDALQMAMVTMQRLIQGRKKGGGKPQVLTV